MKMAGRFFNNLIPITLTNASKQLIFVVNIILASRILEDPVKLAGVGLGDTIIVVAVWSPLLGLNDAMQTLVS